MENRKSINQSIREDFKSIDKKFIKYADDKPKTAKVLAISTKAAYIVGYVIVGGGTKFIFRLIISSI